MRVQLVNDHHSGGGAEVHLHALAGLLGSNGHTVDLLTGRKHPIHYASMLFNPLLYLVARNRFRSFRPDVVHIHKYNLLWSIAPFLAAKNLGIPVVCTTHDFSAVCPEGWMTRRDASVCEKGFGAHCFNTRCLRSTTLALDGYRRFNVARLALQIPVLRRTVKAFTAPSKFLADWVGKLYPGVPSIALPLFIEAPATDIVAPRLREAFTLFHAGRIEKEKGLQFLFEALAQVPGIRFRIAGEGGFKASLQELANRLGIADRIDWLGKLSRESVLQECRDAHLAALPSLWVENAPVFVLEAMREGCPVAASDVGGYPDLIEHGVNGFLVERGSIAGWKQLLSDEAPSADRNTLGKWARTEIARDHSPKRFLERIRVIYNRCSPHTEPFVLKPIP
jgi:glycosyltransferase involved in cell wall biosynthesis